VDASFSDKQKNYGSWGAVLHDSDRKIALELELTGALYLKKNQI
jgi:hypothetical protein